MHKKPNDLTRINKEQRFLVYDKGSKENILFLGSCRMSPLMFYYSNLNTQFNIYNIYTPFWNEEERTNFPFDKIKSILKDTKIIITETISSYGILNTNHKLTDNFFDIFQIKHIEEFRVPNLHLAIYLHDIIHGLHKSSTEYETAFEESLSLLRDSCIKKGYTELYDFIVDYISEIRVFYTFNHPSRILSMLTFKILMNKLNQSIPKKFFHNMNDYHFLEGNGTPITQKDIDTYKFSFYTRIFENPALEQPILYYQLSPEELEIPEKYLNMI